MSPPFYSNLSLRNFRGFKRADKITLAPLTYLVGPNSAGKSSISDALLLIAQSRLLPAYPGSVTPIWNGNLVDLGIFEDAIYKHNHNLSLQIGVEISIDPSSQWRRLSEHNRHIGFDFTIRATKNDPAGVIRTINVTDLVTGECLGIKYVSHSPTKIEINVNNRVRILRNDLYLSSFGAFSRISRFAESMIEQQAPALHGKMAGWRRIIRHLNAQRPYAQFINETSRVSSGRSGPERWYVPEQQAQSYRGQLRFGRSLYDTLSPEVIREAKLKMAPSLQRRRGITLPSVEALLNELEIGDRIDVENYTPYHSIIYVRDNIIGANINIKDVGYGASQVLPVIAACAQDSQSLLVIEQPEVHLHPRAQGQIGEMFGQVSKHRQVIVETHSPHLINRARIQIAKGELDANQVAVIYVDRDKSGSHVHHIPIDSMGEFGAEWPEGFFDERYEDTMTLLDIKHDKESKIKN